MRIHDDILGRCPLFAGIQASGLQTMLECLSASVKHYEKNAYIFMAGDAVTQMGVVLSGGVHIIQEDYWGNRAILAGIEAAGLFGEAFSCAGTDKLPVSVLAAQPSDILLIETRRIVTSCPAACSFHATLITNMMQILAGKNVMLTQKIGILTRKTTREKLLRYLSSQAQQAGNPRFTIPFNRQELAEYLSVDRSAMSFELSKMRDDGILEYEKNKFTLL